MSDANHVTVMPKKLAQALMDAGMRHFDGGGAVPPAQNAGGGSPLMDTSQQTYLNNTFGSTAGGFLNPGGALGQSLGLPSTPGELMQPLMNSYQAQAPNITTQNFGPAISQQESNQADVYGQQKNLANMLLAQSQGNGPGQALVAQQAGNNAAQQGALMASQRGASGNAGLIGRQAAMAGAQGNQQALNTQAQLALQSQSALGQQQGAMANQSLQAQSILQGGQAAQNTAITTGSLGAQQINANTSAQNANTMGNVVGGLTGGMGGAITSMLSKGGEVKRMADGGPVNDNIGIANYSSPGGISIPPFQAPASNPFSPQSGGKGGGGGGGIAGLAALLAHGGSVPAMLAGGNVPGQAKVSGDSEKNDTVPTLLSPGEVVLPRSIAQSPNMDKKVLEFLHHLKGKKMGYGGVVNARKAKC